MSEERTYHFQVNLGGLLDVLSNHLYKSPDVFLREILQNGVDAITLRGKREKGFVDGRLAIHLDPGERLIFRDNGAGLSEEEIHRFLAVIGQSSKHEIAREAQEDYIGRFGIGLLSCFMVSESIVVYTQSMEGGPAYVWTGNEDGTYTLDELGHAEAGTAIILSAKRGMEHYFTEASIAQLVRYYGLCLPVPVYLSGHREPLNYLPEDLLSMDREGLLAFGKGLFEENFLDAIPIRTRHLEGVAFVLWHETSAVIKGQHRIYLKQMLLTEDGERLMPEWGFFLRCFLNTRNLRPTASREDFYEDEALIEARNEFTAAVSGHLKRLAYEDQELLIQIINVHSRAIKELAVWNEEILELFFDYLPFETSEGVQSGAAIRRAGEAFYVASIDRFRQLRSIFLAGGRLLICTGYVNDQRVIDGARRLLHLAAAPLSEEEIDMTLGDPGEEEREQVRRLEEQAKGWLADLECEVQIKRFLPADLPALYSLSDEVRFLRQVQSAKDQSAGSIFTDALNSLLTEARERPLSVLYLNLNCPLIRRLCLGDRDRRLESVVQILYVQALVAGGYPLHNADLKMMSGALFRLLEE